MSKKIVEFDSVSVPDDLFAFNRRHYGEKIRKLRLQCGLNQPQLAERIGLKKNAISNWEAGRSRPDINILPRLCEALQISISEFFTGASQADAPSPAEHAHLRKYRSLSAYDRQNVDRLMESMLEMDAARLRDRCADTFLRIRRSELKASAGIGLALDDTANANCAFIRSDARSRRADEIITVSGDSMEPTFRDGDDLLVEYAPSIAPGEIGVFVAAGEGFVKEFQPDGLHSHNPAYPVRKFSDDDNVRCIGRVLGAVEPNAYAQGLELEVLQEIYGERR